MSDLFVCKQCKHIDSKAITALVGGVDTCTLCRSGRWHNQFEYELYDPERHFMILESDSDDLVPEDQSKE